MKKLVKVSFLTIVVILMLLLAIGSSVAAATEDGAEAGPTWADLEFWPLPKPVQGEEGQAVKAGGTATRIDFEQTEDAALTGWYVVQEVDGPRVAAWYAYDGWQDSGWINNLELTSEAVHVRVLYYPPDSDASTEPTVMTIINHAPGKEYGWLAKGMEHALEVGWPESG